MRPGLSTKDGQDLLRRALQTMGPLAAVVLAPGADDVGVLAAVSPELHGVLKAQDLLSAATSVLGGGGGGRPELAQGKGKDKTRLDAAQQAVISRLREAGLLEGA